MGKRATRHVEPKDYIGSGPKRSTLEREADLDKVAKWDLMGYSQCKMVEMLGGKVTQQQISLDLQEIKSRYKTRTTSTRNEKVQEILERIRVTRNEAWLAWEKSKSDSTKLVEESGSTGAGTTFDKTVETTEGSCGDPAFLRIIADCDKQERELLGLDQPIKLDHTGAITFNWAEMTQRPPIVLDATLDPVEQRIKIEGLGSTPGEK